MRRKLLSWLLVVAMTLSFLPGQARAEDGQETDKGSLTVTIEGASEGEAAVGTMLTARVSDSDGNTPEDVTCYWRYLSEDEDDGPMWVPLPIQNSNPFSYQISREDIGRTLQVRVEAPGYEEGRSDEILVIEPAIGVTLDKPNLKMIVGETVTLHATVTPEDATNSGEITWTSTPEDVVKVNSGVVEAIKPGKATITATLGDVTVFCEVEVSAPPVAKVVLDETLILGKGGTAELTATVLPENADAAEKVVSWSTSDASVATVADGIVTATGTGTAVITASAGGKSASCEVTVPDVTIPAGRTTVTAGETLELTAEAIPTNLAGLTYAWTSSAPAIAAVAAKAGEPGRAAVQGVAAGTSTVTVKILAGEQALASAAVEVTVEAAAVKAAAARTESAGIIGDLVEAVDGKFTGTATVTLENAVYASAAGAAGGAGFGSLFEVTGEAAGITVTGAVFREAEEAAGYTIADLTLLVDSGGIPREAAFNIAVKKAALAEGAVLEGETLRAAGEIRVRITGTVRGAAITGAGVAGGTAKAGTELTAAAVPGSATVGYQWTCGGEIVSRAATYTPTEGDIGKTVTVTVTGTGGYTGSAAASVTVTPVAVESVTLSESELTLTAGSDGAGARKILTATVAPADATEREITWTTSDVNVAAVAGGVVTATGAGTAVITASAGGKSASCTVTVTAGSGGEDPAPGADTDTPDTDTPGTDTPGTDTPGTDPPNTDTPGTDTPGTDTPGTDTPDTDTPGTDTPDTDTPGTDTPDTDTPGTDTPDTDTPDTDTPGTDTPGTDTPGTDTPGTDTPDTDTPSTDTPGADTPGTDTPGADTPGTDTPGADTPGTDTPGTDTPGADPPDTDTPGTDPPSTDTPGTDPPGTDPPSTDTPGTGEPATPAGHPNRISVTVPDKVVAKEEDGSVKVDMTDAEAEGELEAAIQNALVAPDTTGVELAVASGADDIRVELNKGVYDQIAGAGTEVSLTVTTEKIGVTLSKAAIGKVSGGLNGDDSAVLQVTDITRAVESGKPAYVPDRALTIAMDVAMVKGSGEKISIDHLEKPIELLFNIGKDLAEEKITVFYIPEAGDWEEVDDASYNPGTGELTVNVRHLSQFAVTVSDEPIEPPVVPAAPTTPAAPSAPSAPSAPAAPANPGRVPDYTPVYHISVGSGISGGTVSVNLKSASSGSVVTVTVRPESGCELEALRVTKSLNKEVSLRDNGDGTYTFVMPASGVTVSAVFKQVAAEAPAAPLAYVPPTYSFADVAAGEYYYNAVQWAIQQKVTTGADGNRFAPHEACTRGEIVTFLWRAAGSPKNCGTSTFTDVQPGDYYYDAVSWAVSRGITKGVGDNRFAPNDVCTRAQAVTFLYRFIGSPSANGSCAFTDVESDAYYAGAVSWAAANHITNGTTATTFGPADDCTRGHIVTFLYRTLIR